MRPEYPTDTDNAENIKKAVSSSNNDDEPSDQDIEELLDELKD